MDFTRWTSKHYLGCAALTVLSATIIGHFYKNHTGSSSKPAIQQTLTLPKEITPNTAAASTPAQQPITKTVEFKSSIIHHSLAQAAHDAGLTPSMTRQLDTMFAQQFREREIHSGDRLEVLYHEYFVGDQKDHAGHIVAAKIVDPYHKDLSMVRFTTANHNTSYYTPSGESTKPSYLNTPVHYFRIASGFNYHRFDPVIHRVHPHLGVDLDAPTGTPVKAIGDGIVLVCHQMRGYGNVVMIQYNNTYKTLYAHLEKFARHMHPHEHVKKGEIVGYVGTTGWTTGPHLHYSLYKNGKPVNPLTIHFPNTSLPARYRHAFFYQENHWFSEMQLFEAAMKTNDPNAPIKKTAHARILTPTKPTHLASHHHAVKKTHHATRHHRKILAKHKRHHWAKKPKHHYAKTKKHHWAKAKKHHIIHHHKAYA